jgi:GntR family transcriptional regulator
LEEAIHSGRFRPGDRVPGERDLADQLGVSRITVRRALAELAERGVIERSARRGWFVRASVRMTEPEMLRGFAEMARAAGMRASATLLNRVVRPSTIDEAELFGIAPGLDLLELTRVHRLEGLVHSVEEATIPLVYAPGIEEVDFGDPSASLMLSVERAVGGISHADHFIDAIAADSRAAELLEVAIGAPMLRMYERLYDMTGRLVQVTDSLTRGDRTRYKNTVFRHLPAGALGAGALTEPASPDGLRLHS